MVHVFFSQIIPLELPLIVKLQKLFEQYSHKIKE